MVVFGGHVGSTVPYSGFSNSSWSLSLGLNPTWMPLTTTGTPPTADHPYVAIDDEPRHRMIVLDGTVPQVWQLPLESYEWSSLATSSPPSPGTPWGAMYDPSRQQHVGLRSAQRRRTGTGMGAHAQRYSSLVFSDY